MSQGGCGFRGEVLATAAGMSQRKKSKVKGSNTGVTEVHRENSSGVVGWREPLQPRWRTVLEIEHELCFHTGMPGPHLQPGIRVVNLRL